MRAPEEAGRPLRMWARCGIAEGSALHAQLLHVGVIPRAEGVKGALPGLEQPKQQLLLAIQSVCVCCVASLLSQRSCTQLCRHELR